MCPAPCSGSPDEGGLEVSQVIMGQIKKTEPKMSCECMTVDIRRLNIKQVVCARDSVKPFAVNYFT